MELEGLLAIRVEYQDWILIAACGVATSIVLLPGLLRGSRNAAAKQFIEWIRPRRHLYFIVSSLAALAFVCAVLYLLPDWTFNNFIEMLFSFCLWVLIHTRKFCVSFLIIGVFYILYDNRQKIYSGLGLEHTTIVRFDVKDALLCTNPIPVELFIWQGEKIPAGDVLKPNDLFVSVTLGYNEQAKTRVHNNVGATCHFMESMQLNLDPDDEDAQLNLFVCNQESMFSSTLAQAQLNAKKMKSLLDASKFSSRFEWSESYFEPIELNPGGQIWLRLAYVGEPPPSGWFDE